MNDHTHLLVVDWDWFFRDPFNGAEDKQPGDNLYDWGHAETRYHIDYAWGDRAAAFLRQGFPLPRCSGYENFWDRFDLAKDAGLTVADSNVHAGLLTPDDTWWRVWDSVWLYDAHHDCGYNTTYEEWEDRNSITCEDWMLVHAGNGSALNVRYPPWRTGWEREGAPLADVDRRLDDGTRPPVVFDQVFLCRSGAWVPAWCDDQFDQFWRAFPGEVTAIDDNLMRPFNLDQAMTDAKALTELMEKHSTDLARLNAEGGESQR